MTPRPRRYLGVNALTGTVPSELAALTALTVLYVRGACGGAPFPLNVNCLEKRLVMYLGICEVKIPHTRVSTSPLGWHKQAYANTYKHA